MLTLHVGRGVTVDALTVFPVWTGTAEPEPDYLTFTDAEAAGAVTVTELAHPTVPWMLAANTHPLPVLLTAGEAFDGGMQDRVLASTLLLPGQGEAEVPVACVEQRRWDGAGRSRRVGRIAPTGLVHRLVAPTSPAAAHATGQAAVWEEVARHCSAEGAPPDSSLLDWPSRREWGTAARVPLLAGQRGLVIGIGGQVRALEVFDRHAALRAVWDDLLAAAALEARGSAAWATPARDARRLAGRVEQAQWTPRRGLGLGRQLGAHRDGLVGAAVNWSGRVVHLAAFLAPARG